MDSASDFAIDLMLGGFASSVALVMFAGAPLRRLLMAFGLTCAVGILAVAVLGPVRVGLILFMLYLFYEHRRPTRPGLRPRAETVRRRVPGPRWRSSR